MPHFLSQYYHSLEWRSQAHSVIHPFSCQIMSQLSWEYQSQYSWVLTFSVNSAIQQFINHLQFENDNPLLAQNLQQVRIHHPNSPKTLYFYVLCKVLLLRRFLSSQFVLSFNYYKLSLFYLYIVLFRWTQQSDRNKNYYFQYKSMKRGKRQIIQRPIFQSQQQTSSNFLGLQSPTLDPWTSVGQQTQKDEPNCIPDVLQVTKTRLPESHRQNQVIHSQISESKTTSSGEDDRKKRLEMLRQKYLKTGPTATAKQQQTKPAVLKKQQKLIQHVQKSEKYEQKQEESKQSIFNPYINNSAGAYQKVQPHMNTEIQENKLQNETPISKPTQIDQNRKQAPPIPESKRKRAPPPPPKAIPQPQHQIQQHFIQQKEEAIKPQHDFNPFEPKREEQKQQKVPIHKRPQKVQKDNKIHNQNQSQQTISKWIQIIHRWANNQRKSTKINRASEMMRQISSEIVPGCESKVQQIFVSFLFSNTVQYSKTQSSVVMNIVRDSQKLSQLAKVFLSIKCGESALELFCRQDVSNNFNEIVNSLIELKNHLLPQQLSTFIKFYLNSGSCSQQILPLLAQLEPTCLYLYEYMNSIQFSDLSNAAKILFEMRDNITESMCPFYFKLINFVVMHLQDSIILESVVKIVNGINFQSAYQLKKETKLRIIQYIDRINSGNTQPNLTRPPVKEVQVAKNQKQVEKGSGINFIGYFNQALKKITSHIPQKSSEPVQNSQEPKETVEWDPVLKRYKINGKIPEDQYGNVEIPVSQESQDKPKKKAPPPPPPRVSSKATQPKMPVPVPVVTQPFGTQPQAEDQTQFLPPQPNNIEQEEKMGIPLPPRAGLKGMNSKKSRVQVRYT